MQRSCAHVPAQVDSPQTVATSATHAAVHVPVQHLGFTAQISATQGSHVASSFVPVVQRSCSHTVAPPPAPDEELLELEELELEEDEAPPVPDELLALEALLDDAPLLDEVPPLLDEAPLVLDEAVPLVLDDVPPLALDDPPVLEDGAPVELLPELEAPAAAAPLPDEAVVLAEVASFLAPPMPDVDELVEMEPPRAAS